jgi:hypothetical protein
MIPTVLGEALGEDPFALFTRKLQEVKAGIVGPSPGEPAPASTINWWCWDSPGFKDCHKLAFEAAQGECAAAGKGDDHTCIVLAADRLSKDGCPCPATPPRPKLGDTTKTVLIVALAGLTVVWAMHEPKKEKRA